MHANPASSVPAPRAGATVPPLAGSAAGGASAPHAPAGPAAPWLLALALGLLAGCGGEETPSGDTGAVEADTGATGDVDTAIGGTDITIDIGDSETAGGCSNPETDCPTLQVGLCQRKGCDDAGVCVAIAAIEGTACDDGKACTSGEVCGADGKCSGGKVECEDKGVCVEPFCSEQGKCEYAFVPIAQQRPCDDDNACTVNDMCGSGICGGTPIDPVKACDDKQDCTVDACDAKAGCTHVAEPKDKPCFDGDQCTDKDTCDGEGKCISGQPVTCNDGNPCTKDSCDKDKLCVAEPAQKGVTCDDGDPCTSTDECDGNGTCAGAKPAAPSACVQLTCDPKTGATKQESAPDGTSCADDNPCTLDDKCAKGACAGKPLVCNDGNPCTVDACDAKTGTCASAPVEEGKACDDGSKCTSKDSCIKGKCVGEDFTISKACDDGNPCTNDGCVPQTGCFAVAKNSGACDDGNKCSEADACVSGKCVGKDKQCSDGNPCTNDACDKDSGACKATGFDGPCNDGNACTSNDTCQGGTCGGPALNCDDSNPCTTDICDTQTGCKHLPKFGGTPCDDGIGCTTSDKCDGGVCIGTNACVTCEADGECVKFDDGNVCTGKLKCLQTAKGKVCDVDPKSVIVCPAPADAACGASLCDGNTGACSIKNKAVGTPCNSANKCIQNTTCSNDGKCAGTPVVCDDDNPCTDDSCDPAKGCVYKGKEDGTKCDDGSACTPDEQCKGGACLASQNLCGCSADSECTKWDDGNLCNGTFACIAKFCAKKPKSDVSCDPSKDACKDNLCDAKTGVCGLVAKKEGTSCNDGDECTIQESCKAGACKSTSALDCADGSACTFDVCDNVFGCFNAPVGNGGPCSDGLACTSGDKCKDGVCAGVKIPCDDDNPCTVDVCDTKTGKCTAQLDNKLPCDDGDPCTTGDACLDGVCKAAGVKCDDSNPCTIDGCDGKGGCKNILQPNKDCDDGDACTVIDRCSDLGKCTGKAKDCDDANPCTEESCKNGVCAVAPAIGKACNDNNACTENDACNNKGECVASPVNCDDGNPCTKIAGPCSTVNGCTNVPDDGKSCDDGSFCTISDKCSGGACQGLNLPCDDGNFCTNDSCDPKKGCVNAQNTCDDGNDCTFDKCDAAKKGCVNSALDGFQPCNDEDKCTEKGVCNGTKCEFKLVVCDDKDPCTLDACDGSKGCVTMPNEDTTTVCEDNDACTIDLCDGKGKCGSSLKTCDDGNPCTQDVCDKLKGCVVNDLKDGSPCDDGDYCSEKTVCQGGICSGGNYDKCPACENGTDADCKIYDDNDLCNGKFVCKKKNPKDKSGFCMPAPDPVNCDSTGDKPCLKNKCDPNSGICQMKELVNGSPCDDGVPCTVGDTCTGGNCKSGGLADCSVVKDTCNDASCVQDVTAPKGYSCVPLPKLGTVTCDADGDGCTANDQCDKGACKKGFPVDCSLVAKECELAACVKDGANGFTCKITPAKDGDKCEDGQLCTTGDSCKAGKCQAGLGAYECKDEVDPVCAQPLCDKAANGGLGGCIGKPINEGKTCNADNNGCTAQDLCVQGTCIPGAPVNCVNQSTACTIGACKSTGTASYECVQAPVNESKPCEADNNGCTLDDHCTSGKCVPGKELDCSKLNGNAGCLVGTCQSLSASQGTCVAKPAKQGSPCNADDSGCTQNDACNNDGACTPGAAVNCLAQTSTCATGSCVSTGASAFKCAGDNKADGTKCDADGDGCTIDDTCKGGVCQAGAKADCSKENKSTCVVGTCNNKGSAQYLCEAAPQKNGTPCDADKNGCTKKDACSLGFCEAGPLETCKDLQGSCQTATCQDKGGTDFTCAVAIKESYLPLAETMLCNPAAKAGEEGACATNYSCVLGDKDAKEGTCQPKVTVTCSDGDACSEQDGCSDGKCVGYKAKDCNDDQPCTLDLCEKGTCKHQPIPGCTLCVNDDFSEVETKNWFTRIINADFLKVERSTFVNPDNSKGGVLRFTWDGAALKEDPKDKEPVLHARVIHKRVFVDDTMTPELQVSIFADMPDADCLAIYLDETTQLGKVCGKVVGDLAGMPKPLKFSLAKHAGRWIDLEFRLLAGTAKTAKGKIEVDVVVLGGICTSACAGVGLESPRAPEKGNVDDPAGDTPLQERLPLSWARTSTAAGYVNWMVTDKAARTGKAALVASYAGQPSSGKAETARLLIRGVTPVAGSQLVFALQVADIGEAGCDNGDKLVVKVAGSAVLQRCDNIAKWTLQRVDLSAHANKTIDIEIEVQTALTPKAKGTFVIDDITITGACSYLCYYEDFDSMGDKLTWFANGAPGKLSPFSAKLTDTQKVSAAKSLWIESPASPKEGDILLTGPTASTPESPPPQIYIGVSGATVVMQANVFVDPDICASGGGTLAAGLMKSLAPTDEVTFANLALQLSLCKSTSGWTKMSQPLQPTSHVTYLMPAVAATMAKGQKSLKAYLDDFQVICK